MRSSNHNWMKFADCEALYEVSVFEGIIFEPNKVIQQNMHFVWVFRRIGWGTPDAQKTQENSLYCTLVQ